MDSGSYEEAAMRTEADQSVILTRLVGLGPNAMRLDNAARGLCDEVGEVNNVVKKYIEYGQPLDTTNLKEEVGDCLWRLAQICKAGGFSLKDAMEANIKKLVVRYPSRYSDVLAEEDNRDRRMEKEAVFNNGSK